jgi:hypothetical protein
MKLEPSLTEIQNYLESKLASCIQRRDGAADTHVAAANGGQICVLKEMMNYLKDHVVDMPVIGDIMYNDKTLDENIITCTGRVNGYKAQVARYQRSLTKVAKELDNLKEEKKALEDIDSIPISDHAYRRYFERVLGYDMKQVDSEIKSRVGSNDKRFKIAIRNQEIKTIIVKYPKQ